MSTLNDSSLSPAPGRSVFPTNPEEFDADSRVSFSKLDNKFILETDDGQEFEFDDVLKRWVPVVCPQPCSNREGPELQRPFSSTSDGDGESNNLLRFWVIIAG